MKAMKNRAVLSGVILFLFFAALYNTFISRQIFSEGSMRCLPVWKGEGLFLHPINHALYPAGVHLWSKLTAIFGIIPKNSLEFIINTARMNAVAAAISLVFFFEILKNLVRKNITAFVGTVALGFSNAFLFNATNSNEPMSGFLFSMVSLYLVIKALEKKNMFYFFISAFCLSLSSAFYLTTLSIVPGILAYIMLFSGVGSRRHAVARAFIYAASVLLFLALVILSVLALSGDIGGFKNFASLSADMFREGSLWVFFSAKKIIKLFLGLTVSGIYGVTGWQKAFYEIFSKNAFGAPLIWTVILAAPVLALLVFMSFVYCRFWNRMEVKIRKMFYVFAIMFLSTLIPLFVVDPTYEKFWLEASPLFVIIACLAAELYNDFFPLRKRFANMFISLFTGSVILYNTLNVLIPNHFGETKYLKEAGEIDRMLKKEDLLVGTWGRVTGSLKHLYDRENVFIIEEEMKALGCDEKAFHKGLSDRIAGAKKRGGRVYFLGVLEMHEKRWNAFLKRALGLPYDSFDKYRKNSPIIKKFSFKTDADERDITLYEYQ